PPPSPTRLPYTTLFRSDLRGRRFAAGAEAEGERDFVANARGPLAQDAPRERLRRLDVDGIVQERQGLERRVRADAFDRAGVADGDRKSTRLNSSHQISS